MVVKIMVPFWVLIATRHLYLGDPKRDHNVENHPYRLHGFVRKRSGAHALEDVSSSTWSIHDSIGSRESGLGMHFMFEHLDLYSCSHVDPLVPSC